MGKFINAKQKLYKKEFDILARILNEKIKSYLRGSELDSKVIVTDHFVERVIQRGLDPAFVRKMITEAVVKHFLEIVFYMHLENRPPRADIIKDGVVLGFTITSNNNITMRTVFEPDNRYEFLNIRRFIINL